jgi:CRP-like cAMP-binding protein
MRKVSDRNLLNSYITKHNIEDIFDRNILEEAQLHLYGKEELILQAEAELEYYYLLVDGKVKISYLFENGKSMFLKFYEDFNSLGDVELLRGTPVVCNVEATQDTYLIAIPSEILRKDYLNNVKFLRHLVESLSEKLYATINNSSYNYVYPLINRLSSYLIERVTDKDYIILNSSFEEIAQFLGTTYRHLSRTFKELETESIIKCENKLVYIINEHRLRELAKNLFIRPL